MLDWNKGQEIISPQLISQGVFLEGFTRNILLLAVGQCYKLSHIKKDKQPKWQLLLSH